MTFEIATAQPWRLKVREILPKLSDLARLEASEISGRSSLKVATMLPGVRRILERCMPQASNVIANSSVLHGLVLLRRPSLFLCGFKRDVFVLFPA